MINRYLLEIGILFSKSIVSIGQISSNKVSLGFSFGKLKAVQNEMFCSLKYLYEDKRYRGIEIIFENKSSTPLR